MNKPIDLPQLISKLQYADNRYSRLSKKLQAFYFGIVPIYLLVIIIDIIRGAEMEKIASGILYLISLLIFGLLFRKYYKTYRDVDYSLPTIVMLKNAVIRYSPFQKKIAGALVAACFAGAGLYFRTPLNEKPFETLIGFIIAIILAIGVGLIIWNFKYKPLRDAAMDLIKEIEGE